VAKKRDRCPHCPTVLRRLYYQTGSGRDLGARRFVGCGWACFHCGYRTMIERPKE